MKTLVAAAAVWLGFAAIASAQGTRRPADVPDYYVGIVGQSAFGNVTSQSFGVEGGARLTPTLVVFGEAGRVVDAAPQSVGAGALAIAGFLAQANANVAFTVHEPITFFDAGVRYELAMAGKLQPYVLAGGGVAIVKPDVVFTIGGTDVTGRLDQYYVTLGTDLTGTTTKAMIIVGGGVTYPISGRIYADFELRYNRVFASGEAIPFGRAGLGLGIRF